jgi:hypothetical protein
MNEVREKYDDAGELLQLGDEVVAHFRGPAILIGRVADTSPIGQVKIEVLQLLDAEDAKLFVVGEQFHIMGRDVSKARVAQERAA